MRQGYITEGQGASLGSRRWGLHYAEAAWEAPSMPSRTALGGRATATGFLPCPRVGEP